MVSVSLSAHEESQERTNKPILGLLTDFGLIDDAVGICKGLLLSIAPQVNIVDVSHQVEPFDIYQASLYIKDSFRYFPSYSVFACVTFPHTGVQDNAIGLRCTTGHTYFAPNNGLLTRVIREASVEQVHWVTSEMVRQSVIDPTFYGRDIVMSAAAHVANGVPLSEVGPPLTMDDLALLDVTTPTLDGERILGEVEILDNYYGNVWTNITHDFLVEHGIDFGTELEIEIDSVYVAGPLRRTFGGVSVGQSTIYIASRGQLGIALNQGNFAAAHGVVRGQPITLRKL